MKVGIITLATDDQYVKGAIVLGRSLRKSGTVAETICMISSDISPGPKLKLEMSFDRVVVIDIHDSKDVEMLALLKRPELGVTWTKLCAWKFTEYTKMIFMDADMIVLQPIDELFDREELSAVPDCGWPSCFNSGLFVFKPSRKTYEDLCKFAAENRSWDGGDQGLLNSYFSDWSTKDISRILPYGYNVHAAATYTYIPAVKKFQNDIKAVHFLGTSKPWHSLTPPRGPFSEYWQMWWSIYNDNKKSASSKQESPSGAAPGPVSSETGYLDESKSTQTVPSVGTIEDILTHIDSQIKAPAE